MRCRAGATTLWEQWTASDSRNHILFGDISNWFIQHLAGIGLDPEAPGSSHVLIRPQVVGGSTWAKGRHIGPHGQISSAWPTYDGKFRLNITIPANSAATVWIPTDFVTEVPEGAVFLREENGTAVYAIGSGSSNFAA